jgi:hypothetical protein
MLRLTKKQEEMLHLLRLDGLRREIELHEATEEYNKAAETEKAVQQYVIDNNEFFNSMDGDPEKGNRITDASLDYLIDEEIFASDYLPKVQKAFKELYNIDNDLNFVYSEPMRERKVKAQIAYDMISVDFLRICGNVKEAETLEKAIKGYMRKEMKDRLDRMNADFLLNKGVA